MNRFIVEENNKANRVKMTHLYQWFRKEVENEAYITKHSLKYEPVEEPTESLIEEAKEFDTMHEEEIRRLYDAFGNSGGSIAANVLIRSLIQLVYLFMRKYNHINYDNEQQCRTDMLFQFRYLCYS